MKKIWILLIVLPLIVISCSRRDSGAPAIISISPQVWQSDTTGYCFVKARNVTIENTSIVFEQGQKSYKRSLSKSIYSKGDQLFKVKFPSVQNQEDNYFKHTFPDFQEGKIKVFLEYETPEAIMEKSKPVEVTLTGQKPPQIILISQDNDYYPRIKVNIENSNSLDLGLNQIIIDGNRINLHYMFYPLDYSISEGYCSEHLATVLPVNLKPGKHTVHVQITDLLSSSKYFDYKNPFKNCTPEEKEFLKIRWAERLMAQEKIHLEALNKTTHDFITTYPDTHIDQNVTWTDAPVKINKDFYLAHHIYCPATGDKYVYDENGTKIICPRHGSAAKLEDYIKDIEEFWGEDAGR